MNRWGNKYLIDQTSQMCSESTRFQFYRVNHEDSEDTNKLNNNDFFNNFFNFNFVISFA